jgi:hypothetical protein
MTRPGAAKAQAYAGMRAGRARARGALLALRRTPRGCLGARGEFGCNLAGRATVFLMDVGTDGQLYAGPGKTEKKSGEGGEGITYHVWHSEVRVGAVWHAQGEVTHPCLPFW